MTETMAPDFVLRYANMASAKLGAIAITASDEFFAPRERMLQEAPPIFITDKFDANGKWMDGWETRRRRTPGHDFCVIKLAARCRLYGLDIDTAHFTGNYPEAASLDAFTSAKPPGPDAKWREVIPRTTLAGNAHHFIAVDGAGPADYLRLNIFPDGGIARLRVYGEAAFDWDAVPPDKEIELSAFAHGGKIVAYNDAHYGSPWSILTPGRGVNMADGWETRRRRTPGHDWIVVALGAAGYIEALEIDTAHFKGNYPEACSLNAALKPAGTDPSWADESHDWPTLLKKTKLGPDRVHHFTSDDLNPVGAVNAIRLNIYPDGGISRLRLIGRKA